MKKSALFLTVALALAGFNAQAYDFEVDSIYYDINDDSTTVSVTYASTSYASYSGTVAIPSQIVADGVTYPVTSIGYRAFYNSTGLDSVSIPSSVTTIGVYAFRGCTGLTSIVIPETVSTIDNSAFYSCSSIASVDLKMEKIDSLGEKIFYGCKALTSVVIPEIMTFIPTGMFYGCSNLSEISLPSTLNMICTTAFRNCTSLTSISLPESVDSLEGNAFRGAGLKQIKIPDKVKYIDGSLFYECDSLSSVEMSDDVWCIYSYAFYGCSSLTSITLPSSLKMIGASAFRLCGLTSLEIPEGVEYIDDSAIRQCENLQSVALPSTIKADGLGKWVFLGCTSLEEFEIIEPITEVTTGLLSGCTALKRVTIPRTVQTIGLQSFYECSALEEIIVKALTPPSIHREDSFSDSAYAHATVYVPKASLSQYKASYWAYYFKNIENYVADFGLEGDGSEETPYLISSASDWNSVANYMANNEDYLSSCYLKLTDNIDFADTAIVQFGNTRDGAFAGYLDGNGKTISGIDATADTSYFGGLFVELAAGAVVHDLTVEGKVTSDYACTGGIVGNLLGTLSSVVSRVEVVSTANSAAGIAGYGASGSSISECVNEGSVSSSGLYAAGIVGSVGKSFTGTCCVNRGTVTYTGEKELGYAAGVVGYGYNFNLNGCWNEGVVSAANADAGGLAGVVGYLYSTSNNSALTTLTGCYNTSDISSAGGNAGVLLGGVSAVKLTMDSCYNTGNITSTGSSTNAGVYTAGVAGTIFGSSSYSACWNSGNITSGGNYTGGVLGYEVLSGLTVSTSVTATVDNCWNLGEVTSTGNYAGGVAAYGLGTYTNIYNMGNVTAADYAGGLIGYTKSSSATITTGYSAGTVTATGSNVGNAIASENATLNGVYCLTGNAADGVDSPVGLTYAALGSLELDGWINGDSYSYPRLADNSQAKAFAAAVIPADGDTYDSITRDFHIGIPDGVVWTCDNQAVEISGNEVSFTQAYEGTLTLTATCDDVAVATTLTCNVEESGIGATASDGRNLVDEKLYSLSGQLVGGISNPATGSNSKSLYIVVKTYDDGTSEAVKEIR